MECHEGSLNETRLTNVFLLCGPPFLEHIEIAKQAECIIQMNGDMTTIRKPDDGGTKSFSFDHSYWSFDKSDPNYAGQQRLYDDLGVELLNHSFSGYNTCIVACKCFSCCFYCLFFCAPCLVLMGVLIRLVIPRLFRGKVPLEKDEGRRKKTSRSWLSILSLISRHLKPAAMVSVRDRGNGICPQCHLLY